MSGFGAHMSPCVGLPPLLLSWLFPTVPTVESTPWTSSSPLSALPIPPLTRRCP